MPTQSFNTSQSHKSETPTAYLAAYEKMETLVTKLQSASTQRMTHSELENLIEVEGRELLRRLFQSHLHERAQSTVTEPVIGSDGQPRTHQRTQTRALESVFGTVEITRTAYGGRGLESLHPLDAELNLPTERYSHTVRRRAAEAAARESYDEVVAALQQHTGAHLPKRQAEQIVARSAQDFDAFYEAPRQRSAESVTETSELLIISADGKGVPMRKADLRAATRQAAELRQPHLKHRASKGEKPGTKRMGTVAAVYTIAPFVRTPEQVAGELRPSERPLPTRRPRPEDKRVWASVKQPPAEIIRQAFAEATGRDPRQQKRWCALVDGNRTQLKLLKRAAKEQSIELTIVLDLIPVLEYLWGATWVLYDQGDRAAENWVSVRLLEILRGHSSQVAAGLRRSATWRSLRAQQRAPLDKCADYLLKYRAYLRYDQYLAAGLPIVTGVIEGACRYLVKDRMEKTGARWSLEGAEAVLRLRSLWASGDFDDYWQFHLQQEFKRQHASRYVGETVPKLQPLPAGKGAHFRLVK